MFTNGLHYIILLVEGNLKKELRAVGLQTSFVEDREIQRETVLKLKKKCRGIRFTTPK